MKPLDFTEDRWTGSTWELINPKTNKPVDLNLFRDCEAERVNYAPYQHVLDECWKRLSDELDNPHIGSSVFVRHWANTYVYYLMLGEREAARQSVLTKINPSLDRKEVERIQKESEKVYNNFENMFYEKLKNY